MYIIVYISYLTPSLLHPLCHPTPCQPKARRGVRGARCRVASAQLDTSRSADFHPLQWVRRAPPRAKREWCEWDSGIRFVQRCVYIYSYPSRNHALFKFQRDVLSLDLLISLYVDNLLTGTQSKETAASSSSFCNPADGRCFANWNLPLPNRENRSIYWDIIFPAPIKYNPPTLRTKPFAKILWELMATGPSTDRQSAPPPGCESTLGCDSRSPQGHCFGVDKVKNRLGSI